MEPKGCSKQNGTDKNGDMNGNDYSRGTTGKVQFDLRSLFDYVTVCAVLLTLSPVLGRFPSGILCLAALALWLRSGVLALLMIALAVLATQLPSVFRTDVDSSQIADEQSFTLLTAGVLSLWYKRRSQLKLRRRRLALSDNNLRPSGREIYSTSTGDV